jgi:aminopeptidase N
VIANGSDAGYYRVQYDAGNMARLRTAYPTLPPTERIGLVADTMALAGTGRIEFAEYFQLLDAIRDEKEGAVWQQVIDSLVYLDDAFYGSPAQASVRAYGRFLLGPVLGRLGWRPRPTEDAGTQRLRGALIDTLGRFDDAEITGRCQAMFAVFAATPSVPIEPSIRPAVIRTAARSADAATFETLRRMLREASNEEDNYLYGDALIVVRDPKLVTRILELSLTDEWPPGNASWYARSVGAASGQPKIARDFILQNFDAVVAKSSRRGRPWMLPTTYSGFSETREADDLLDAQRRLLGDEAMAPAEQIAALIREKAALRDREEGPLPTLLKSLSERRQAAGASVRRTRTERTNDRPS